MNPRPESKQRGPGNGKKSTHQAAEVVPSLEAAIIQRQGPEKKFGAVIVGTRRSPVLMLLKLAKDTYTIEGIRRQE
jgi:hypothetical protein